MTGKVNLTGKLALFDEHWSPRVVADYNGNDVMVVKFQGAFPFHEHPDTDDFFLVLDRQVMLIEPKGTPNTGDPATAAPKPRL